jgi:hypothetical protein
MVDAAPMPTAADLWKAKFCEHIVGMLTLDGQGWAVVTAQRAAQCEYDALEDYSGDPIESANECMSSWDCEPDFTNDAATEPNNGLPEPSKFPPMPNVPPPKSDAKAKP